MIRELSNISDIADNPTDFKIITNVTDDEKLFIKAIFEDKDFMLELNDLLTQIQSDGVIDFHDAPAIVLFMITIFKKYIGIMPISSINLTNTLKFTCECIIFGLKPEYDIATILIVNKVLDSSIKLLEFEFKTLMKTSNFCLCCKFCIRRKYKKT